MYIELQHVCMHVIRLILYSGALRGKGTPSGQTSLPKLFCLPSEKGSTLKGKNLLPSEKESTLKR